MLDAADAMRRPEAVASASLLERVGCSLLTFWEWGLEEALDRVRAHGFTRLDLAFVPGHCEHFDPLAMTPAKLDQLAGALEARGLTVSSINLHPGDMAGKDFELAERRIRATLDVARRVGARVLTLPPGRPPEFPEAWEPTAAVVAKRVASFVGRAEQAGVTLTVEAPHAYTLAEDVDQAARLFELIRDPRIACTFDTSHAQRKHRLPLWDMRRKLGVPVAHVHLRDTLRGEVTVTPGKGDCEYLPFLEALRRDGYAGDLTFELEYGGFTREQVERELAFAREHVRLLLAGEPLPSAHRRYHQGWYRALDTTRWAVTHPKDFIIAHPRIKATLRPPVRAAKHVLKEWVPYRVTRYEAGWKRTWRVGKLPSAISPRLAPAAAPSGLPEKRVVILGCGYTGKFEHGPGFARLPGARVVGVCDVRADRATALGARLGCPSFTELDRMLDEAKPDLVVNCTREWHHHATTQRSLAAGADVFCEKILAESLASGEEMVRTARERGRVLGVNFNWRFLPGIQRLRQLRDEGSLGKLRMIRMLAHAAVAHHALDLAVYLGGPAATLSATCLEDPGVNGLEDWTPFAKELLYMPSVYALTTLQTRDGVGVSLSSSLLLDYRGLLLSVDAVFDEATVTLSGILDNDARGSLSVSSGKKVDLRLPVGDAPSGFAQSFQRSIEAFYASWREGKAPPTSGEDALEVMRLENAIVRSNATGTRITL